MPEAEVESTDVLIVGGGVVGLSAAAFLAWHGVPCQAVERRTDLSIHPRARGFNPRAVELLRQIGLEPAVREVSNGFADHTIRARVESLTGRELFRADLPTATDLDEVSPSPWALCSQDRLEPLLRRHAEDLGADIRFGHEMRSFAQDADGVTVTLQNRKDGTRSRVRARYLVGADGVRSRVRQQLGIELKGTPALLRQLSIVFEADLRGPLGERRFAICQIQNETVEGLLVHDDTLRQGTLYIQYDPAKGQHADDFPLQRCVELVRAAVGVPDLPVRVLDIQSWELSALSAARYGEGRVFLAGDAVHVMPPVGGFGASTGIQDAHNLAWKLAHTLRGQAGPALLDTYEAERAPVADYTVDQCLRRVTTRTGFGRPAAGAGLVDDLTLTLGYRYAAGAVIDPEVADTIVVDPRELRGDPGTRAPHVPLRERGSSTLDLFGRLFTVLAGQDGEHWIDAARGVAAELGVDLEAHRMTDEMLLHGGAAWCRRHGVGTDGVVLVRPDGIVAWRRASAADRAADELRSALRHLLDLRSPAAEAPRRER
ncbi:FAD-dependent monooxygenase [Streptosporangium sp. NPDC000396]|uniref:FAD-dependent monooxygenase n=1 Tax=Streptosporangium sp. NPDC000396 TaxID=3366185 RepID=UPI0036963993